MAYPKKLEKLFGAALVRDSEFREMLYADPMAAAKAAGVRLRPDEVENLRVLLGRVGQKRLESLAADLRRDFSAVGTW